jgi:hypothetical protein
MFIYIYIYIYIYMYIYRYRYIDIPRVRASTISCVPYSLDCGML